MNKPTLREILQRAMMTGPNRWTEATINDKLVSYFEIHDEKILEQAIKQHYLGLIGEDKPNIAVDKTSSGFILGYNAATAELRQAIESEE